MLCAFKLLRFVSYTPFCRLFFVGTIAGRRLPVPLFKALRKLIVLKGQNRRVFEDKLKTVTRRRMAKFGEFKVNIVQSTLYVEPLTEDCDLDGAWEACGTIN